MKNILLIFAFLTFTLSCNSNKDSNLSEPKQLSSSTQKSTPTSLQNFKIHINNNSILLETKDFKQRIEELGYISNYSLSEKNDYLILDVQVFSDIGIIELYQYNEYQQKFTKMPINYNTEIFEKFRERNGNIPDNDILRSTVYFKEWNSEVSFTVDVYVDLISEDKRIEDVIEVNIK